MRAPLSDVNGATPEWLTDVLRSNRVLPPTARVVDVRVEPLRAWNSKVVRLVLTYSGDATATAAPASVVLKLKTGAGMAREVAMYKAVNANGITPPLSLVRCYDAVFDPASDRGHVVLGDLSQTHATPVDRDAAVAGDAVPTEPALSGVFDTLAAFHAHWWEHPRLGRYPFDVDPPYASADGWAAKMRKFHDTWDRFAATPGFAWVSAADRATYERLLERLPVLYERFYGPRFASMRKVTLNHGEPYYTQWLAPRNASALGRDGRVHQIDFDALHAHTPGDDLMFLIPMFWRRHHRRDGDREMNVLRRYHAGLVARGVTGYAFDDLLLDYRIALCDESTYPVWDVFQSWDEYWQTKMRCMLDALEDWRCLELLA